jgi:hypothetical protein
LQDSNDSEDEDNRRSRPQCAEYLSDKTFKPDDGDWKRRYNSLADCFENCDYEEYDVIVWNEDDSRCFCWDKDDGKWEAAADSGDVAYDLTPCRADDNRNRGRDPESEEGEDPDSGDSEEENRGGRPNRPRPGRGDDDSSDGESEDSQNSRTQNWRASVPRCALGRRRQTFKPRDGKTWARKYDGLDECFDRCFDSFEVIVWNQDTDKCYCWREESDGRWEASNGWDDLAFDLTGCNRRGNVDSDDDSDETSSGDSKEEEEESSEVKSEESSEDRNRNDDSSESEDKEKSSKEEESSEEKEDESSEEKKKKKKSSEEEEESSEEKDGDDTRAGTGGVRTVTANVPLCATMNDKRIFRPRANVFWPPAQYNNLDTCFQRCFDSFDFIVLDRQGRGCHCWRNADGWWEWPEWGAPADVVFDLRTCRTGSALGGAFNPGFPATGPTRGLPQGNTAPGTSWGSNRFVTPISGECGQSSWTQEWNVREGMECTGNPQKTIQTGFNIYYSFSSGPATGNGVQMWRYDGTLEGCKRLFPMDQWNILLNGDIDIGSGSWMQWDSQSGECRLFLNNQACSALSLSQQGQAVPGQSGQYTTARYCQSSTSMIGGQG